MNAINLWSYKRDNVSPLVAGIFPYNGGDAGEGEFTGMIRSKLTSDIERDANGRLKINSLEIDLEDVVRESAGEESLIGYLHVPAPNLDSDSALTRYFKNDNLPAAQNEILDVNLQSGFYQGEVCSYFSTSNPSFVITVKKEWNGQPSSDDTNYEATLICENRKTGETIQTITATSQGATTLRFSNLRAYDENNELIEYTIYEELPDESPWRCTVEDKVITYNSEEKIVRVKNDWAETAVDNNAIVITQVFVNDVNGVEKYDEEHGTTTNVYQRSFSPFIGDGDIANDESGFNQFKSDWLISSEAKNSWEFAITSSSAYNNLAPTNSAALFCSRYIWRQYYWKEVNGQQTIWYDSWCEMSPFFSIVIRDSDGKEQFYSFSTEITSYGDTQLDEIPYPYVSSRVGTSVGHESTALQWKRGAAGSSADDQSWVNSESSSQNTYSGQPLSGTVCYSGEPTSVSGPAPYNYTAGNLAYSSIDIKSEDGDVLLKNFCIFCADRMCMDSNVAGDLVPYFYKVSVKEPIDSDGFGVLEMKISKVDKSSSFVTGTINLSGQSNYHYHAWSQNYNATNNPYTHVGSDGTTFEIDQPALRSALEGNNGIFYSHIEAEDAYKSIFAGGGDN